MEHNLLSRQKEGLFEDVTFKLKNGIEKSRQNFWAEGGTTAGKLNWALGVFQECKEGPCGEITVDD